MFLCFFYGFEFICISVCMVVSVYFLCLFIICLFVYMFICSYIYLFICLYVCIYLFVYMLTLLHLLICLFQSKCVVFYLVCYAPCCMICHEYLFWPCLLRTSWLVFHYIRSPTLCILGWWSVSLNTKRPVFSLFYFNMWL